MSDPALVKRDSRGRLLPGSRLKSPGQPAAVKARKLKEAILRCETEAKVQQVWRRLRKAAIAGEPWAVKEYLKYIIGQPKHSYDPRIQDGPAPKSQGPQYTAQERLIIARAMMRQAEQELRGEEAIEAEGDEVRDG